MNTSTKIKIIWLAIAAYGALVLVNALVYAFSSQDTSELARAGVRTFGAFFIVYGIHKRVRWMYWVALIFTGALSLFGILGLGGLALSLAGGAIEFGEISGALLFLIVSVPLLTISFILLFMKDVRSMLLRKSSPQEPIAEENGK